MRKILFTALAIVALLALASAICASADETLQTSVTATVGSTFSFEFYTHNANGTKDHNIVYSTNVPFSDVSATSGYNYADGRAEFDGKSDVGLLVITNQGNTWHLKIGMNSGSSLLGSLGYYMGQPTNRNWEADADGTLGQGDWADVPSDSSPKTMYTAGANDKSNGPLGTLATLSYKVDGGKLSQGVHTGNVTYTLTETP